MKYIFFVVTIIGSLIGALLLILSFAFIDSAPQQGALAAVAVGFAVIPYCLARATQLLTDESEAILRSVDSEIRKGVSTIQPDTATRSQRTSSQRAMVSPNIGNTKRETIVHPEKGATRQNNQKVFTRTQICPSCSEANRENATVCFSCGSVIPGYAVA